MSAPGVIALSALLALSAPVMAGDDLTLLNVSGFGTIGGVITDNDHLAYRSSSVQDSGAGRDFDPTVDSVLGLQMTGRLHPSTNITVQAVSRKGVDDSYAPQITWAFLRYQIQPDLSVRVGRTRTPFFMFSDALNVNYITPWVRPPVEVYSLNPFSNIDGVDMLYRGSVGTTDVEVQGMLGKSDLKLHNGSVRLHNAKVIKLATSGGGLTTHASYTRADLDISWGDPARQVLADTLTELGYESIAKDISGNDSSAQFISAGFQYEHNNWLLIGEYARRSVDRYTSSAHGWYLSTGYRFGNLTPYVTYSRQMLLRPATQGHVPYPALERGIQLFNDTRNNSQRSFAVGMRWDMARNIALKGQLEEVTPGPDGLGTFLSNTALSKYETSSRVHILSLSMDFVF